MRQPKRLSILPIQNRLRFRASNQLTIDQLAVCFPGIDSKLESAAAESEPKACSPKLPTEVFREALKLLVKSTSNVLASAGPLSTVLSSNLNIVLPKKLRHGSGYMQVTLR